MRILLCPDSFKESISASDLCSYLKEGMLAQDPTLDVKSIPIADGGEGLLEAVSHAKSFDQHTINVNGPLGEAVEATYSIRIQEGKKTAIIESAEANGLHLLPPEKRNPLKTTSYGVGQLLLDAIDRNPDALIVGLGGSSTNDGGVGMLQALGFHFLSASGEQVPWGNEGLGEISSVEIPLNHPLYSIPITVASDVTNPLTGGNGATLVFGRQKGRADLQLMEQNMIHYKKRSEAALGRTIDVKGSGAAGGLGAAFYGFLQAEISSGFAIVADLTGLEKEIEKADIVVTGEGKLDTQTLQGKAPSGVLDLAGKYNKPVVAVCGISEANPLLEQGFAAIVPLSRVPIPVDVSMSRSKELAIETGEYLASKVFGDLLK